MPSEQHTGKAALATGTLHYERVRTASLEG